MELLQTPDTDEPHAHKPRGKQRFRDFLSLVFVLVAAVGLAFILIAFVFQSYRVDGPSMQNTLHNNDHLIIWKVPRSWARLTGHQYVPDRGDIVIINQPGLGDNGQSKQIIKRVLGLPGDRVVVKNGEITIYNTAHPNGFRPDATMSYKISAYTDGDIDIKLKSGQVFVFGDNRGDSTDSRIFGPVDTNNIIGKLVIRVMPANQITLF